MFENEKKNCLGKIDKSRKGSIDLGILDLVEKLNKSDNYYTTSSCSGRIVLLKRGRKNESLWAFVSHNEIKFEDICNELEDEVWFRFEPMILHVACRTIEDCQKIVDKARECGFRRSGIQSIHKNIVEVSSSDYIETIIGGGLAGESYIQRLILEANKRMKENKNKIKRFMDSV